MQPVKLTVDTAIVLRTGADKFIGINLNYIRDGDANRPDGRPLVAALKDMGVRWLRFPGGEKSDFHLWSSEPPYNRPKPLALGWYGTAVGERMDFDQYMKCVRAVSAEPYLVVGYDSLERTKRTRAQWLENAVSWVRYANRTKKYGVKYWEIGNENWHNGTAKPDEMARIVTEFSRAMKAIDPTIQIGASGNNNTWWAAFLPLAAPALDFISMSLYNCWEWKNYRHFIEHPTENTISDVTNALRAIDTHAPPADRSRLRVAVVETNSKDYSEGGWSDTNTLGHALVTFDTLGRVMAQPRVLNAMVWTTRWMKDTEAKASQWYALGAKNELMATGYALALWGKFVQADLVAVSGGSPTLTAYASRSADGRALRVWVLNRALEPANAVQLQIRSAVPYASRATVHRLSGTGPDDAAPRWETPGSLRVTANAVAPFSCPPVSVTVLSLKAS